MRDAFFSSLEGLMDKNDKVVFITADMGFRLFDKIAEKYPDRVMNVGVREAAMIGLAAGLSKEGFMPFVYSLAPFVTLRSLEQIRNDLCYNKNSAVIVGAGAGLAYGPNGPTHMGIEDVSVMSALSNMTIVSPCDPFEVRSLMPQIISLDGPVYFRLGRNGEPVCRRASGSIPRVRVPSVIRTGGDALVISYGAIVYDVLAVIAEIEKDNDVSLGLISHHTVKPLNEKAVLSLIRRDVPVIVIEEQVSNGALGSGIALILKRNSVSNPFYHLHLPDSYPDVCGDRDYLLRRGKLSPAHIKRALLNVLKTEKVYL